MKNLSLYNDLKRRFSGAPARRMFTELDYALQLNKALDFIFSDAIDNVIIYLDGLTNLTENDVFRAEEMMAEVGKAAKKQQCICVSHAHIDVNWLWGYDETVAITLSTFDTMLKLLDAYPAFTFSQSTGFVFKIVEKYRPEMLERIKKYVKEGRFEITGATFVEADKNSPSASSLLRQTEYTKHYLAKIFDKKESDFVIDFEPDTFGHTLYEPEILAANGIKYLYHCRGNDLPPVYRWFAPSGKSVLVYREPFWYNGAVEYGDFAFVPDFCKRYGTNKALRVYGVGDHGGGTTMRDVERLLEIASYPVMADVRFGTYLEFFEYLDTLPDVPEIRGEQNDIFTGCYSSASEIKQGNEEAEIALYEQELLCHAAGEREFDNRRAVERILVNHFHDVITGSGVEATRVYALARLQEARAELGAYKDEALRSFEKRLNTLPLYSRLPDKTEETAYGAGVGFGAKNVNFTNYIAYGKERAYVVINQLNFPREVTVTLPLWDYYGDVSRLKVYDPDGNELPFAIRSREPQFYWYHNFHEVTLSLFLGAMEYRAVVLREEEISPVPEISYPPLYQRTEQTYGDVTLENERIRARFDKRTFALTELTDKKTGENRIAGDSGFRLFTEDITEQMTAWYVGRIKSEQNVNVNPRMLAVTKNAVCQSLTYELRFSASSMTVTASVNKGESGVRFHVDGDFKELGSPVDGIPDLRYTLHVADFTETLSDADPGIIKRPAKPKDVPAFSFIEAGGVMLIGKGKHGFRGENGTLSVCLLRASCDPHPAPEYGKRSFDFGAFLAPEKAIDKLRLSKDFRILPIVCPVGPHAGNLPVTGKIAQDIPETVVCLSARKDDLTLFNPEENEICFSLSGKTQTMKGHEIKRFCK